MFISHEDWQNKNAIDICRDGTIINRFRVNQKNFLILSTGEYDLNRHVDMKSADLRHTFGQSGYIEILRFVIGDNLCFILEEKESTCNDDIYESLKAGLTARELQIATLVAQGKSNKQIAKQLHISEWTVATHLRRIFLKLDVDSRAEMVFRCSSLISIGILSGSIEEDKN
ncbi:MAG: response regulator transcription factor [Synechococcus sp.]